MAYFLNGFFVKMGLISIALLFLGFVPFVHMRVDATGTYAPILAIHGVLMLMWYALFTYQATLVGKKNIVRHKTLGQYSLYLVGGVIVSGFMVAKWSYDTGSDGGTPLSPDHFLILPMGDLLLFTSAFVLAYLNRKTPSQHKRYMWLASLLILDPATVRFGMTLGFPPLGLLIIAALLALLIYYDKKTMGAVQKATKIGMAMWAAYLAAIALLGPTEAWSTFVQFLFGGW